MTDGPPGRSGRFAAAWATWLLGSTVVPGCAASADPHPVAPPPTARTPSQNGSEAALHALLDRIEAVAAERGRVTARLRLRSVQDLLGDETVRFGDLAYAAAEPPTGPAARFAVTFDRLQTDDGAVKPIDRRFVYDGRWLLQTDADARTATRRDLGPADPDSGGAGPAGAADQNPVLLALTFDKAAVLRRFNATLGDGSPEGREPSGERAGAAAPPPHLILVPRASSHHADGSDLTRVDLFFDPASFEPLQVAVEQVDGDRTVADLFEFDPRADVPDHHFDTALPTATGWDVQTVEAVEP